MFKNNICWTKKDNLKRDQNACHIFFSCKKFFPDKIGKLSFFLTQFAKSPIKKVTLIINIAFGPQNSRPGVEDNEKFYLILDLLNTHFFIEL